MKSLRRGFERFCYQNRHKGIPNLMLYITIGNAVVYLFSLFGQSDLLYSALCFDKALILQGQVWRLLTCVFTSVFGYGNILFVIIGLFCYYSLGRAIEHTWGTFRFNLYYLSGLLLMEIFAMIFADVPIRLGGVEYPYSAFYADMGSTLNLTLFITYATLYQDSRFLLLYIIPVKAWIFGLVYLTLTLYQVFATPMPHGLFPLVAFANYFLFFGKDVLNLIPASWRINAGRLFRKKPAGGQKKTGTIPFAGSYQAEHATPKAPYTHRCAVCGRTDVSNPELEFRYCSRCNGYFCYCQEHINDHIHVE